MIVHLKNGDRNVTFIPFAESHFSLMLKWLRFPHVKRWWDTDVVWTPSRIKEKYSDYVKGYKRIKSEFKPIKAYIICLSGRPIGYIQLYNAYDFPRSKPLIELPEKLAAMDVFIGELDFINQGIGPVVIQAFLKEYAKTFTHVFTDPALENLAAIRAYEKAGFRKIRELTDTGEVWMLFEVICSE